MLMVAMLASVSVLPTVRGAASGDAGALGAACCSVAVAAPAPAGAAGCPLCVGVRAEDVSRGEVSSDGVGCGCVCPGCRCAARDRPALPSREPTAPATGQDLRAHLPAAGVRTGWVMETATAREHAVAGWVKPTRANCATRAQLGAWLV
ncbi:MAG: hypothetical protein EA378_06150 [Phycisphaerales bacterium]|nr:MAG: hypothetical protein EA378_06150 [Phycisphaerales bacterium]